MTSLNNSKPAMGVASEGVLHQELLNRCQWRVRRVARRRRPLRSTLATEGRSGTVVHGAALRMPYPVDLLELLPGFSRVGAGTSLMTVSVDAPSPGIVTGRGIQGSLTMFHRLPATLNSATPYGATLGFMGIALSDNSSTLQACR